MADVVPVSDGTKTPGTANSIAGLNLVDLTRAHPLDISAPKVLQAPNLNDVPSPIAPTGPIDLHLNHLPPIERPHTDSTNVDTNRKFVLPDLKTPQSRQLSDIYENGIIKLFQQPNGHGLFGLRVSSDHSIRTTVPEIRGASRHGVALEFRLKF